MEHEHRVEEPCHGRDARIDQRGGVRRPDERHHETEQGGIAPSAPPHGEYREGDEPAET